MVYPAFVVCGGYAERWNGRQLTFYVTALGFLNLAWMWLSELVVGFVELDLDPWIAD